MVWTPNFGERIALGLLNEIAAVQQVPRFSPTQAEALFAADQNRRVWYEWSRDPKDLRGSRLYVSARLSRSIAILVKRKLLERAAEPSPLGKRTPLIPSERGRMVIDAWKAATHGVA